MEFLIKASGVAGGEANDRRSPNVVVADERPGTLPSGAAHQLVRASVLP